MTKTTKTNKTTSKVKRTAAASLAAIMVAATAASISASAAPGRCELLNLCNFTRTADDIVKGEMKNKSYSEVLKKWQTALKDPTKAFPNGCDIDGDGETTEEEKNEVADKLKEYAAGMTVGLMKMGLNKCCDGLADCFEGPMGDFANALFDVPQEASNDDIIDKIDESTNLVLKKIEDSENNIVNRTSNLNVASEYGKIMDKYDSAAGNHREAIKTALNEKNNESKTVEIAYSLGDLGEWADKNIVTKRGEARTVLTADYCTTDPEHHYNLYKMAFKVALDKGSLFMKEAVENSQRYVVNCTNKYLKSSITLLQMLAAMEDVSKFTPDQISKLSASALTNYNKIKDNAYKADSFKAQVLDDLLGDNGILTKSTAYVERKVTEPTTYVGRGQGKFVKLRSEVSVSSDLGFIEPRDKIWFGLGKSKWYWKNGSDTTRLNYSGLTYKEYEGIGKHAFATGYNIENYLKANGFTVKKAYKDSYKNIVLPTAHFDEYHGTAFKGYYSHEGFNGYDITKGYSKNADAPKWNLLHKIQKGGVWMDIPEFNRENLGYGFLFFEKA
ncbi:MAG: hypothetical protein ILA17_11505 [Ruminococcus sp.]|nr:hypothetical protein [Ruminococcus sp.]